MFSNVTQPHLSSAATTTHRTSRRRQRVISDDSPKASQVNKKQRSTFYQPDSRRDALYLQQNPSASANANVNLDLNPQLTSSSPVPAEKNLSLLHSTGSTTTSKLALRGPRKLTSPEGHLDSLTLLSQNELYSVTRLQPLQDEFYKNSAVQWRYVLNSTYGYALALSRSEAVVWSYSPGSKSSASEPMRRFSIPDSASQKSSDPLPLGLFVSRSVEDSPGMIVVIPSTGKIILWETISNATVLGLTKPKQTGIHGSIQALFPGEYATHLVNAEPSGVLVALSTGRLAHVSIRDPQGRPALVVNMLRGISGPVGTGFFASFRNVFSGSSWKRTIVSIKAGTSFQRGQRDVLVATSSGLLEVWDTRWNHGNSLKAQIDLKRRLTEPAVFRDERVATSFELVDFVIASSQSTSSSGQKNNSPCDFVLYVLYHVTLKDAPIYIVSEVTVSTSDAVVGRLASFPSFESMPDPLSFSPRLCAPRSENSVVAVFGSNLIFVSLSGNSDDLATTIETPSSLPEIIGFHIDRGYSIQACELEPASTYHEADSCLVMVHNYGLVRITPSKSLLSAGDNNLSVTVKSRLEQAIFFAESRANPIRFNDHYFRSATDEELDKAVYDIGSSILRSTCPYIYNTTPSLEQQLQSRAGYLDALASYAQAHQFPLSQDTKSLLMSGAEKLASQRAIWALEQGYKRLDASRVTHLEHVLSQMSSKFRTRTSSDEGDDDHVRQWFIQDTWRAENIVPWILNGVKCDRKPGVKLDAQFATQLQEAIKISLATLETAFEFRDAAKQLYGLYEEEVTVTEHWTSSVVNLQETARLLDLALNACIKWMHQTPSSHAIDSAMEVVRRDLPRSFRVLDRMDQERLRWFSAQSDPEIKDSGRQSHSAFVKERRLQLYKLAGMGLLNEALELAEIFSDMEALVELMSELHKSLQPSDHNPESCPDSDELRGWKTRIDRYFSKFGKAWSTAFFSRRVTTDEVGSLFRMPKYQASITAFLRSNPDYSSLSWINDILGEADYSTASKTLRSFAVIRETNLWNKRIELSIGKIALLANIEQSESPSSDSSIAMLQEFEDLSELSHIQELLYELVSPLFQDLPDSSERHNIAKQVFAPELKQETSVLFTVFVRNLLKLSAGFALETDELIDVLTLMETNALQQDSPLLTNPFPAALRVLSLCRR
ncbi:hypothetical protein KEM54_001542, partial [Ascosphaera aggregata]